MTQHNETPGHDVLIADVCTAEFGWELMCWQAYVRYRAVGYNTVVVSSTVGHEPLYADMPHVFVPHRIEGLRDCWRMKKIKSTREERRAREEIDGLERNFLADGRQVTRITPSGFIPTSDQLFVPYGSRENARGRGIAFDIVVHARTKKGKNPLLNSLNWSQKDWNRLVAGLRQLGHSVAAVGTKDASLVPDGAIDMQGADLQAVMDTMSAARVVIGPSSGPMHLASLCRTHHIVWVPPMHGKEAHAWGVTRARYETIWNPFNTPHTILELGGRSDPELLIGLTAEVLGRQARESGAPCHTDADGFPLSRE